MVNTSPAARQSGVRTNSLIGVSFVDFLLVLLMRPEIEMAGCALFGEK
jgi:hypothetical protein